MRLKRKKEEKAKKDVKNVLKRTSLQLQEKPLSKEEVVEERKSFKHPKSQKGLTPRKRKGKPHQL